MTKPPPDPSFTDYLLRGLAYDAEGHGVAVSALIAGIEPDRLHPTEQGRAFHSVLDWKRTVDITVPSFGGVSDAALCTLMGQIQARAAALAPMDGAELLGRLLQSVCMEGE